jgi:NAD(P)-dependent dehydrogenase (short-subunit alcohol dehydrogenase family)
MDMGLKDAVVLVTGGTGGIGRRTALAFAAEGARVAITYRSREDVAKAVADEIADAGGEPYVVPMTLNDPESIEAAVRGTTDHFGGLDVLVANAVDWGSGDFHNRPIRIEDAADEQWQPVIRANLEGNFRLVRHAAPALRNSAAGRVVLLSSDIAESGFIGSWAYGAAKAGLHGLAVSLAHDLGRDGVLVNVVLAGVTLDDGHHRVIPDQMVASIAEKYPANRLATSVDVAAAVLYLSSRRNGATTGEILHVTGGRPTAA